MATNIYASKEGTLNNVLKKTIITFTNEDIPTIPNYNLLYSSLHGQNPDVRCIIQVSPTVRYERQQNPQFTYVSGLISTIYFELGEELTGYLILT
jgi:predicted transcriptional regulator